MNLEFKYIFSIVLAFVEVGFIGVISYNHYTDNTYNGGSGKTNAISASSPNEQYNMGFTFTGDKTELIDLRKGPAELNITYHGNSDFIAKLIKPNGEVLETFENNTGSFTDKMSVTAPETGVYVLDVHTVGEWSVSQH